MDRRSSPARRMSLLLKANGMKNAAGAKGDAETDLMQMAMWDAVSSADPSKGTLASVAEVGRVASIGWRKVSWPSALAIALTPPARGLGTLLPPARRNS
jgi:TRAP-type C4-dicarboxylate transport system permease large subunit